MRFETSSSFASLALLFIAFFAASSNGQEANQTITLQMGLRPPTLENPVPHLWAYIQRGQITSDVDPLQIFADIEVNAAQVLGVSAVEEHDDLNIEVFHSNILQRFPNVQEIYGMENVGMARIGAQSFRICQNLRKINFDYNQIEAIPAGVFSVCTNLEVLSLSNNQISTFVPASFQGLGNLQELYLGSNQITALAPGIFAQLTNLEALDISQNQITEIQLGVLPPSVFVFSIAGNQISELNENLFQTARQLLVASMGGNPISELPAGLFRDLLFLGWVDLNSTNIRRLNSNSFGFLPQLRRIDIADSEFDELQHGFFNNFPNMIYFNAEGTPCADVNLNFSYIDFNNDTSLNRCFAQWFVPRPQETTTAPPAPAPPSSGIKLSSSGVLMASVVVLAASLMGKFL